MDFVARFGATATPDVLSQIISLAREKLDSGEVATRSGEGFDLVSVASDPPQIHDLPNGWIAIKGIAFDRDLAGDASPQAIFDELTSEHGDVNRFEGAFALILWDERKKSAYAVNDQASVLNLYFTETPKGIFVSTNGMLLAKALGLGLSAEGVAEFLARGVLLAPRTMFAGIKRLNVGEHLRIDGRSLSIGRHWRAYADELTSSDEVVDRLASTIVGSVSAFSKARAPVLCDLTGGYDSRLVLASVLRAGVPVAATVNGASIDTDVRIAAEIANKLGLKLHSFDPATMWTRDINETVRRSLIWRSNGELRFTEIYHHLLTRPQLARDYPLHMVGCGGEMLRYFPWSQEFFGIGKRRRANVERAIRYRFLGSSLPVSLAPGKWLDWYRDRLASDITAVCDDAPGAGTTEQLDAVYVWKMTGHSSLYLSSLFNWLPTVAPLLTASAIKDFVSVPWQMKLTSGLQRSLIETLSPAAASVRTSYGATAAPPSLSTLHLEAYQTFRQAQHALEKIEKVVFRGVVTRGGPPKTEVRFPIWTEEFSRMLDPQRMKSAALYNADELANLVLSRPASGTGAARVLVVATIEELCRELDYEIGADFFDALYA